MIQFCSTLAQCYLCVLMNSDQLHRKNGLTMRSALLCQERKPQNPRRAIICPPHHPFVEKAATNSKSRDKQSLDTQSLPYPEASSRRAFANIFELFRNQGKGGLKRHFFLQTFAPILAVALCERHICWAHILAYVLSSRACAFQSQYAKCL